MEPLTALAGEAEEVYAMFNNNRDDFAPQGAQTAQAPARQRRPRRVRRDRAREARPAIFRPVNVLAVVHGANCPPGAFRTELERRGHDVDEWSLAWGSPPPRPIDDYGAVMIFGGSMHADQDDHHPWLRDEQLFLQRLLDLHMPLLGVCLGSQLIAKAAHAPVGALETPEVGWIDIELTEEAADDPVFSALPERFSAFQWHFYGFDVPAGAVELARSDELRAGLPARRGRVGRAVPPRDHPADPGDVAGGSGG